MKVNERQKATFVAWYSHTMGNTQQCRATAAGHNDDLADAWVERARRRRSHTQWVHVSARIGNTNHNHRSQNGGSGDARGGVESCGHWPRGTREPAGCWSALYPALDVHVCVHARLHTRVWCMHRCRYARLCTRMDACPRKNSPGCCLWFVWFTTGVL